MNAHEGIATSHPAGHFYSPIVNPDELMDRKHRLWRESPRLPIGLDFKHERQKGIVRNWLAKYVSQYDYPEHRDPDQSDLAFYTQNSQFSWLDARFLFAALMQIKPRKIIEVGSGFSSLLMADVKNRLGTDGPSITCIEPFPRSFLKDSNLCLNELVVEKVQNIPRSRFLRLQEGDILFIDSSHVMKTGSDVHYLLLEIMPILKKGVIIHFHDIFLPAEYPKKWVLEDNRSWNEQYALQLLLTYSSRFEVLFGCTYAFHFLHDELVKALAYQDGRCFGGGSFWIVKI